MTLQFIPARGRKLAPVRRGGTAQILQFIPARGRKRPLPGVIIRRVLLQFIPARGRKLESIGKGSGEVAIAIYPHKGTEMHQLYNPLQGTFHCNLSPQGDGNTTSLLFLLDLKELQFIPARGRKRKLRDVVIQPIRIAIYPRKGTKKHLCHWRLPVAEVLCFFLQFYFTGWKLCQPESSL